jgi:hypothetical protein
LILAKTYICNEFSDFFQLYLQIKTTAKICGQIAIFIH